MQLHTQPRRSRTPLLLTLGAVLLFSSCIHVRGHRHHRGHVHVGSAACDDTLHTGYHLVSAFFHVASALSGD